MKNLIHILLLTTIFYSCQNSSEQNLENLDKQSSREVTLSTITKKDTVLHITKQVIWLNGQVIQTKQDTIKTALNTPTWDQENKNIKLNEIPIYVTVQ